MMIIVACWLLCPVVIDYVLSLEWDCHTSEAHRFYKETSWSLAPSPTKLGPTKQYQEVLWGLVCSFTIAWYSFLTKWFISIPCLTLHLNSDYNFQLEICLLLDVILFWTSVFDQCKYDFTASPRFSKFIIMEKVGIIFSQLSFNASPCPENVAVLYRHHGSGTRGSAGEAIHSRYMTHKYPAVFLYGHGSVVVRCFVQTVVFRPKKIYFIQN